MVQTEIAYSLFIFFVVKMERLRIKFDDVLHQFKLIKLYNVVLFWFIIASMQSICLEGLGGGNKFDPILQDTTFIKHIFGGCL